MQLIKYACIKYTAEEILVFILYLPLDVDAVKTLGPSLDPCGQCAGVDVAAAGAPRPPPRLLEPDPGRRRALPLPRTRAPATAAGQPAPSAAGPRGQAPRSQHPRHSQTVTERDAEKAEKQNI